MADFLAATDSNQKIRVEADLGFGFVRLRSEEAERRQAIHDIRSSEDVVIELLRNARDAGAQHIYLATSKEGDERFITVIDDGCGIPSSMHKEIFESRVTSKLDTMALDKWGVHGRGMALYSITVNTKTARVMQSAPGQGTAIRICIDSLSLTEKRDQSTYPTFEATESGAISVRGPKNIIRTTCEFALDTPQTQVYLGSATEIAATLYHHGRQATNLIDRVFDDEAEILNIPQQLAYCQTPATFQNQAEHVGLSMSERSARRILDEEIKPLPTVLEQLAALLRNSQTASEEDTPETAPELQTYEPDRGKLTSFASHDLDQFREDILKAYKPLADAYYLNPFQEPRIKLSKGILHIAIPVEKQR